MGDENTELRQHCLHEGIANEVYQKVDDCLVGQLDMYPKHSKCQQCLQIHHPYIPFVPW